jgi:hypothetical protein
MSSYIDASSKDLQETISKNQLKGLWRMMVGFRLTYLGADVTLGIAASIKTGTSFLLA